MIHFRASVDPLDLNPLPPTAFLTSTGASVGRMRGATAKGGGRSDPQRCASIEVRLGQAPRAGGPEPVGFGQMVASGVEASPGDPATDQVNWCQACKDP